MQPPLERTSDPKQGGDLTKRGHTTLPRASGTDACGSTPVGHKALDVIVRQGGVAGIQLGAACQVAGVGSLTSTVRALNLMGIE
jgi:hypothetical protein